MAHITDGPEDCESKCKCSDPVNLTASSTTSNWIVDGTWTGGGYYSPSFTYTYGSHPAKCPNCDYCSCCGRSGKKEDAAREKKDQ
jgi:hypothetical protein